MDNGDEADTGTADDSDDSVRIISDSPGDLERARQLLEQDGIPTETIRRAHVSASFSSYETMPVPSPADCERWEKLYPGATERLFGMIEKEQNHRHEINRRDAEFRDKFQESDHAVTRTGQIFAFIVALFAISAEVFLSYNGHPSIWRTISVLATYTLVMMTGKYISYLSERDDGELVDDDENREKEREIRAENIPPA